MTEDFFNSIDPEQTSDVQCNRLTDPVLCHGALIRLVSDAVRSIEPTRTHHAARRQDARSWSIGVYANSHARCRQ
jgi:hypothetical protein